MKRFNILLAFLFVTASVTSAWGQRLHKEKEYQEYWCAQMGGQLEFVLDDSTRVDCLTDEYAVEVDFADKWAEAVGQSLYYAHKTGRRPGILLIIETPKQKRYLPRLQALADKYNISIWQIAPTGIGKKIPPATTSKLS